MELQDLLVAYDNLLIWLIWQKLLAFMRLIFLETFRNHLTWKSARFSNKGVNFVEDDAEEQWYQEKTVLSYILLARCRNA